MVYGLEKHKWVVLIRAEQLVRKLRKLSVESEVDVLKDSTIRYISTVKRPAETPCLLYAQGYQACEPIPGWIPTSSD